MKNYIFLSLFFYSSLAVAQKEDEPKKFYDKLSSTYEFALPFHSSDTSSNPVNSNWFSYAVTYEISDDFLVGLGRQKFLDLQPKTSNYSLRSGAFVLIDYRLALKGGSISFVPKVGKWWDDIDTDKNSWYYDFSLRRNNGIIFLSLGYHRSKMPKNYLDTFYMGMGITIK